MKNYYGYLSLANDGAYPAQEFDARAMSRMHVAIFNFILWFGFVAIILAGIGIYIMIGTKISNGTALGNAFAFITPLCFTTIVIIIRKFHQTDMVPAVALSGVFCMAAGAILTENLSINIPIKIAITETETE